MIELLIILFFSLCLKPLWKLIFHSSCTLYRIIRFGYGKYKLWDEIKLLEKLGHRVQIKRDYFSYLILSSDLIIICPECENMFYKDYNEKLRVSKPGKFSPADGFAEKYTCSELIIRDII